MSRCLQGFMLAYCQELTGIKTASLKKLFNSVLQDSPRAAEPLALLALAQGRDPFLEKLAAGTKYEDSFADFFSSYRASGVDADSFVSSLDPTDRYGKAAAAWKSEQGKLERDRLTLKGVAREMNKLLAERGLSRAEACKMLGLDKGNFYAFLKGDARRLGRSTAMEAYQRLAAI